MGRPCTALIFGAAMPRNVDHEGNESDGKPPDVVLEKYRGEMPDTFSDGDCYMVGFTLASEFEAYRVLAVEDITLRYKPGYTQARKRWAKFAAWLAHQGVVVEAARLYFTPSERP